MRLFKKTHIDFLGNDTCGMHFLRDGPGRYRVGCFQSIEYGIDFRGGTELVIGFSSKLPYPISVWADKVGLGKSEIKSYGSDENNCHPEVEQGEERRSATRSS